MSAPRTFTQHVVDWTLGALACIVLLLLMAWMDSKQSETDAMRITAQVVKDRAVEHAAMRGPR